MKGSLSNHNQLGADGCIVITPDNLSGKVLLFETTDGSAPVKLFSTNVEVQIHMRQ